MTMVLNYRHCSIVHGDPQVNVPLLPVLSFNAHNCRRIPPYIFLAFSLKGGETCLARCVALRSGEAGDIGQAARCASTKEYKFDSGGSPHQV